MVSMQVRYKYPPERAQMRPRGGGAAGQLVLRTLATVEQPGLRSGASHSPKGQAAAGHVAIARGRAAGGAQIDQGRECRHLLQILY